jgi:hypothetical protein
MAGGGICDNQTDHVFFYCAQTIVGGYTEMIGILYCDGGRAGIFGFPDGYIHCLNTGNLAETVVCVEHG